MTLRQEIAFWPLRAQVAWSKLLTLVWLGMFSHKMSIIKNFVHKRFDQKIHQKIWQNIDSYLKLISQFWSHITSNMIDEFWKKWQLWPKNVIIQMLQSLHYFISTLGTFIDQITTVKVEKPCCLSNGCHQKLFLMAFLLPKQIFGKSLVCRWTVREHCTRHKTVLLEIRWNQWHCLIKMGARKQFFILALNDR